MIANYSRIILLFMLISAPLLFAQNEKVLLDSLKDRLANFEYSETIRLAEDYINVNTNLSEETLTEIYLINGIANYSLRNEADAKKNFKHVLEIASDYKPNPLKISPKIISFFEEVRTEYLQEQKHNNSLSVNNSIEDSTKAIYQENFLLKEKMLLKDATIKSIILPGWGQQALNLETKGWALTLFSLASLGSTVYFIVDTNKKEKAYLTEIDNSQIQSKYNSYNHAYQIRNFSIGTLAAVWVFNLIDILFLSN